MSAREAVADFWDDALDRWVTGRDHLIAPLPVWLASYQGTGKGVVDMACYPDPYVGDLRGTTHPPRMVLLGLNPGRGYGPLQGRAGTWTQRIADVGYSRCFQRSPAEDPDTWIRHHGKPSPYWKALIRFGQRWTDDAAFDVHDILNFELYPWHSDGVTSAMAPPADLIDRFVWQPVEEVGAPVFAFGAPWFALCESLQLAECAAWGPDDDPFPISETKGWRLKVYRLDSGQFVVVSAQPGYAGPPAGQRLAVMRSLLDDLGAEWDGTDARPSQPTEASWVHQQVSNDNSGEHRRRIKLALEVGAVLHRRGYQRLRVIPGVGGTGSWRCAYTPATNVTASQDFGGLDAARDLSLDAVVAWTSADEDAIFGVTVTSSTTADELADALERHHPQLVDQARGRDWEYVGWYQEMLTWADTDWFPVFYADYLTVTPGWTPLVTETGYHPDPSRTLPAPPPPADNSR